MWRQFCVCRITSHGGPPPKERSLGGESDEVETAARTATRWPHTACHGTHPDPKRCFCLIKNHDIESLLNLFLILHPCYCLTVFEKNSIHSMPRSFSASQREESIRMRTQRSSAFLFFLLTRITFFRWIPHSSKTRPSTSTGCVK